MPAIKNHKTAGRRKQKRTSRLWVGYALGFLEFVCALVALLLISGDPKNAFLFGYSISRLLILLVTLFMGIFFLVLAIRDYRGQTSTIQRVLTRLASWTDITVLLFLIGCLVAVVHPDMFNEYRYYFERVRPPLIVFCVLPVQLSLLSLNKVKWKFEKQRWFPEILALCSFLLLFTFMFITKLGLAPDRVFWNVAGMPLSTAQLILILIVVLMVLELVAITKKVFPRINKQSVDLLLCLVVFLATVLVWNATPYNGHFFSNLTGPSRQPYPYSDAQDRDIGALSILIGSGISFEKQTDSPLYEVFLSFLHLIAGYDYQRLVQLQILCLAIIPVLFFLLGTSFQGRFLGLTLAAIIIVRQSNAILLSRMIASSNPYLLTTELPTFLMLAMVVWLTFIWLTKGNRSLWLPFFAGSSLGMASLIRVNPVIILPAIPLISLAAMWKLKKVWLKQNITFLFGFLLLMTPWLFSGMNEFGDPFYFQKFRAVVEQRYESGIQDPNSEQHITSFAEASLAREGKIIAIGSRKAPDALLDPDRFPGFAINHFLHNIVTSLLALPDSISNSDQILTNLALRPYWVERNQWAGELHPGQIMFILINLVLLSLGMGWAWKRLRWAGMVPLFIYLVYLGSLGLARTSGSRYIVPVDWVFFFYYSIGIVLIFEQFANLFKIKIQGEFGPLSETTPPTGGKKKPWLMSVPLIFLLFITASIPIADNLIPVDRSQCEDESYLTSIASIYGGELDRVWVLVGRVLYPAIKNGTLSFILLTCKDTVPFAIQDFEGELNSGQLVIMVVQFPIREQKIDMIASYEQGNAELIWDNR